MRLLTLFFFIQEDIVNKKLAEAPDNRYAIGVLIVELLPFVILVAIAYIIYYRMKKRKDLDEF